MINVAVLGFGTVGSGVVEVINENNRFIRDKIGDDIRVKYVLDLREFKGEPVEKILVHDFDTILQDKDVQIVVETMGGLHPSYEFTKSALEAGKNVCTSNKELVAEFGYELSTLAIEKNVNYMFEASCGGGIPIIRPLYTCLTAEDILEISGIMNGTTNYILTKMEKEGVSFEDTLRQAQDLGYAEKNPQADVEGYDPCRKIAILSSVAYGKQVDYRDIYCQGITGITPEDFLYCKKLNKKIKLLATSTRRRDSVSAIVAPFLVGEESPLYFIDDVFNGIFVKGNMLGDSMFMGSGAGKLPTASAVVGDVVDCGKHLNKTVNRCWSSEKINLTPHDDEIRSFFIRVKGDEEIISRAKELIRVKEVIKLKELPGEFALITQPEEEGKVEKALKEIPTVNYIRIK